MKKENINVIWEKCSWEDAVRASGNLLVGAGSCTSEYVEDMILSVKNLGPYIVIAPSIALAHSRPSKAVKYNDISLAIFKQPVKFGHETNDPVSLVFSFCATEQENHLDMLGKLADLLSNEKSIELLINCNSVDEVDLILNK